MSLKGRIIKYAVKNHTFSILKGAWEGVIKFVQHLGLFKKNEHKPKATQKMKKKNKKYSEKGNQDGVLW